MRIILISITIASCFLISHLGIAQEAFDRDSLWQEINKAKPDTNKVWLYIKLGQQYETNNPDSSLLIYESALKLSEQLKYMRGIISYYTNATFVYNLMGRYDTALTLNLRSVEIAKAFGNPERLAACLGNVGASYVMLEQKEKAIEIYHQIIPLFEKLPVSINRGVIFENLSVLYNDINQPAKGKEFGIQAVAIYRKFNNDYGLASALNNLSNTYTSLGEYNKALDCLKEALYIARSTNNQYGLMMTLLNLGNVGLDMNDFTSIRTYAEDALQLSRKLNDPISEIIALRGLGIHYFNMNNAKEAEKYTIESLQLALKNNSLKHIGKAYSVLSSIAILKKDFRASNEYAIKSDSIARVIMNESIAKNIQNLEAQYETQKKENQIKQLQQEAEIKDLSIKKNTLVNAILVGAFAAMLIIALLARYSYQQKKKLLTQENSVKEARIAQLESEKLILAGEAVIKGQEEERGRLAKDLHDGLGGMLSGVKFSLSNMRSNVVLDADSMLVFERSLDMLDHSIAELRRVAHNMMPEVLVRFGLPEALKSYCESLRSSQLFKIDYQTVGTIERLPDKVEIFIFRIVQELLNNTIKHAQASHVLVQLARDEHEVTITVEDDGVGFNPDIPKSSAGAGLTSIKSRVDYLKGKMDIKSGAGQGTSVHIHIPVA